VAVDSLFDEPSSLSQSNVGYGAAPGYDMSRTTHRAGILLPSHHLGTNQKPQTPENVVPRFGILTRAFAGKQICKYKK
jgi:hypothetical protein